MGEYLIMKYVMFYWASAGHQYLNDAKFSQWRTATSSSNLENYPYLQKSFENMGWVCQTQDYFSNNDIVPDAILYMGIPSAAVQKKICKQRLHGIKQYCLILECEIIEPESWVLNKHYQFDGIFTWKSTLVDNLQYHKIFFAVEPHSQWRVEKLNKQKLCAIINANKKNNHPLELYSKRVEAIRWFENNHPQDFDFYGHGWEHYQFYSPKILRALNRIPALTKLLAPKFSCYQGSVEDKTKILSQYKFSLVFENAQGIDDYITEKIFDCFNAGCVPIYYGAPNIKDCIPENCYIDFRGFSDYQALYDYISKMPETEYLHYLNSIRIFISSDNYLPHTPSYFADTIAELITNESGFHCCRNRERIAGT